MGLKGVVSGRAMRPPRVVVYGKDGVGKTTFAAGAGSPIFLPTEEGADEVGADRFPVLEDWQSFLKALGQVAQGDHEYGTVVVDSLDWLERLIWADVAKDKGVSSIEDIGYGKGYAFALDRWRRVLAGLDLCRARGLAVVLLAHAQIKRFDSPEVEPFDRYCLKLKESASALIREWCDVVAFATDDVVTKKSDVGFGVSVVRGQHRGTRSLRLVERPAYDAKNRYGLPESIPFPRDGAWDRFVEEISKAQSKASAKAIAKNGADDKSSEEEDNSNSAEAQKEEAQHGEA